MRLASRVDRIEPFHVMEVAKRASALLSSPMCDPAQGGRRMLFLNIGEPDRTACERVQAAAKAAIEQGQTAYTAATGLPALRQAISRWYAQRFKVDVDPRRVIITAGASAALQLAMLALVEPGDEVICPDPSYPCNRHFVTVAGGQTKLVRTSAAQRYALTAQQLRDHWGPSVRGTLLASPSNPTGTSIDPVELMNMVETGRSMGGWTVVDEIYLGLSYDPRYGQTALALGEDVISVNSFSKYFGLTGWRLGWLVVPPEAVPAMERLAQHLYICASTIAQRAALACFEPDSLREYEQRRGEFQRRRDFIVPSLREIGWPVPVEPDGAFYAWMDTGSKTPDSSALCLQLMHLAQVTLTPGRDFGPALAHNHVRLSFASSLHDLKEAIARMATVDRALLRQPWTSA